MVNSTADRMSLRGWLNPQVVKFIRQTESTGWKSWSHAEASRRDEEVRFTGFRSSNRSFRWAGLSAVICSHTHRTVSDCGRYHGSTSYQAICVLAGTRV